MPIPEENVGFKAQPSYPVLRMRSRLGKDFLNMDNYSINHAIDLCSLPLSSSTENVSAVDALERCSVEAPSLSTASSQSSRPSSSLSVVTVAPNYAA